MPHPLDETVTAQQRRRARAAWDGNDRRRDKGGNWTWGKEIIGTVLGVLPFVAMVLAWGVHVETVQAQQNEAIIYLKQSDDRQDQLRRERNREIDIHMERIEQKLDRIIEKQAQR